MKTILEPKVTKWQVLIVPVPKMTIEPMVTDDEKQAFSARLNRILDEIDGYPKKGGGRQVKLGKDWDVTQKAARKWLEAESIPELTRLMSMARRYGVNFEWLTTGRGEPTYIGVNISQEGNSQRIDAGHSHDDQTLEKAPSRSVENRLKEGDKMLSLVGVSNEMRAIIEELATIDRSQGRRRGILIGTIGAIIATTETEAGEPPQQRPPSRSRQS
ncbi:hypothetical protein QZM35_22830 [Burkholderia sp. AU45274]|uniref:hypothetical protein n=1 Tax=Burkholderia sp. AU45274 TaxID=3059205 RepID=UPI002655A6AC|nr:hypothetical protein [Burkholderia sp. AU45274]MDN7490550.1 hypothetical protein [Burkholderia sp. AU45274]